MSMPFQKKQKEEAQPAQVDTPQEDPNTVLTSFLEEKNIRLEFDMVQGTVPTKKGFIMTDKPVLVIKAVYGRPVDERAVS